MKPSHVSSPGGTHAHGGHTAPHTRARQPKLVNQPPPAAAGSLPAMHPPLILRPQPSRGSRGGCSPERRGGSKEAPGGGRCGCGRGPEESPCRGWGGGAKCGRCCWCGSPKQASAWVDGKKMSVYSPAVGRRGWSRLQTRKSPAKGQEKGSRQRARTCGRRPECGRGCRPKGDPALLRT